MDAHSPPLVTRLARVRLRPWQRVAVDGVVAVLATTAGKVPYLRYPDWLAVVVLALAALPVVVRQFWPRAVLAVVVLSTAAAIAGTAVNAPAFLPLGACYAVSLIPLRYPRREALGLLCGTLAVLGIGLAVYAAGSGSGASGDTSRFAAECGVYVTAAWLAGYVVQQQRSYTAKAHEQAAQEVREQLAEARRISSEERLEIARELHDVVAHTVSLIAVQAGVANYVVKTNPDEAARALASIETTSRGALREMRALLAMLRADGSADGVGRADGAGGAGGVGRDRAELVPVPGLADLDDLLARTAEAGLLVDLEVRGDPSAVSAGIDLAAYRVIQEAITNVIKHAATDTCRVTVGYERDALSVEVTDHGNAEPGRISGLGHGLVGMRERVGMYGGEFRAGPLPGRGFRVTARLPLTEATDRTGTPS
ncbi:sensor histidine kinase [Catenulispora sp. NF23]|uniref:sensor histidine kinase n=1 Tax=Catenulispora pinistramenti TaxID=2705254 RepID=UPI001BA86536|nr:sensor histidine kinase [Catenulispora pinistramenti]MBS2532964.1 sensor histidine kinase [Catenulispora pinistramenti]